MGEVALEYGSAAICGIVLAMFLLRCLGMR
jgi:hypothetical protein